MTRCEFLKRTGLGIVSMALTSRARRVEGEPVQDNRPNIVLIMADDMGFSDIGCYGSEIHTPNLDKLAGNGLRFTQFYNTARCCPTRASLLTGLYPHQSSMGWMTVVDLGHKGYHGEINRRCVTIAEVLKSAGYGTYMAGKWHLTRDKHWNKPKDSWPCQRGFDRFFGTIAGSGSYFDPVTLTRNNVRISAPKKSFYYTDAISDNATEFITDHLSSNPGVPFFLYVAYTAPHWPLHAKPEDIAKYKGTYMQGWDVLREQRHKRMIDMGIVDETWSLTPRDSDVQPWDKLDDVEKEEMDMRMAVYAAQIDCMDQGIGRIVATLDDAGQLDNTLIMFLSDNGACAEMLQFPDDEGRGLPMERSKFVQAIGSDETFASYGIAWANVGNTPFRLYKHWVHEGGISTPLIVHWPARVYAKGELRHQPAHLIDIMPTCVHVSGAEYPEQYRDTDILPMEGRNLLPVFDDRQLVQRTLFWEHESNCAVRDGKWKLVSKYPGKWELYNMNRDRTETNNLANKFPYQVEKMVEMWKEYAARTYVYPLDGRDWQTRVDETLAEMSR